MTPERWKKVEEVLEAALEQPPAERPSFLARACAGDEGLRREVETLISSYERAGDFIEAPILGADAAQFADARGEQGIPQMEGRRVGSYRIVRELGRGGMGAVYLAERADDEFRKNVAIKLVKRGMDTDFILRRFRQERQILAQLEHPNIARLLDGGTTDDGLPYFVMEYVEGQPVHHYSDARRLPIAERLRLFVKVCSAVEYAHRQGVVHRDLKPGNILVTADGTPKLLDFGIAKLLNPDLGSPTMAATTTQAFRLMTPEYASPEQLRGETITAATDIYSLGVVLYELLTGHRPYRLRTRNPFELARIICEEEPERPSVVVNLIEIIPSGQTEPVEITPETVSRTRAESLEQLRRQLSGTLDQIALRALRKEPARRYPSVAELAADINRYLEGQHVSAAPLFPPVSHTRLHHSDSPTGPRVVAVLPFKTLLAEKKEDEFLGMGMADAIITKLSNIRRLVVRPTSSVLKYLDGEYNLLAAGREMEADFVLDGRVQRAADRVRVTVQLVRVRDGASLWAAQFDEKFTDIFTVEDSISGQVAEALTTRVTGEERELLRRHDTESPEAHQEYLKGRYFWNKLTDEGFTKAYEHFQEAIRLDPEYALAYAGVADYFNWAAIFGMAPPKDCFPQAKAAAARALELDDRLSEAHAALGFTILCYDWDGEAAEQRFRRAIELDPNSADAHQWYSNLLAAEGRFEEAVAEARRAQELKPLSLVEKSMTGWVYYQARQFEAALQEIQKTLEMDRNFGNSVMYLGSIYVQMGQHDEGVRTLKRAVELMEGSVVPMWFLGHALAVAGRREEAQEILEKLRQLSEEVYVSPYFFALIETGLGNSDAAFGWLEKAYEARDEWLIWLGTEPKLDPLRGDPRYEDLLKRVGLAGAARRAHDTPTEYNTSVPPASGRRARSVRRDPDTGAQPAAPRTGDVSEQPRSVASVAALIKRRPSVPALGLALALGLAAAGGFGLYKFFTAQTRAASSFLNHRTAKLTATGNAAGAAVSPDGQYVVYVTDEGGRQGLWVRGVASTKSVRVVPPSEVSYRGLTFSRDGTYVYYVVTERGRRAGALYRVPAFGGSAEKVSDGVDSPIGVSPDGRRFAFVRSNPEQGEDTLFVSGDDGKVTGQLVSRKYPERFYLSSAPAWSPDGQRIACAVQSADANGFYMKAVEVGVEDRAERPLTEQRWVELKQMAWLSDGSGLMMTAQDENSSVLQLYRLLYPGGQPERITNDLSDYRGLSLSDDGSALVSVQRQTFTSVWLATKEDYNRPMQVTSGAGRYVDLSWTPDGRVLYASDASGNADIWEMAANGTEQRQLTAGAGRNYAPVSTPDGRYVVFHSNRSGRWQIWRMERDGTNPVQLTSGTENSNWPQATADGRFVIYEHSQSGLWKIPIDGGAASRLTSGLSLRPSVSPDGRLAAYWQKDDAPNAPWRIGVIPVEGGEPQFFDVPQNEADGNSSIHWTPDSSAFVYTDFRDNITNLRLQPLRGGEPAQLTNFKNQLFYSFDLARDGRLLLAHGLTTDDVVIITDAK